MTRSELIEALAKNNNSLTQQDIEAAVKTILEGITNQLANGDRVEIRGFGSFSLNHRPARIGRNPKTGDRVEVPPKYVPHFKAGRLLKANVDTA